ncbi:MAG: sulfatase [Candidatus Muiribacterium halophilum]|uniref:Sulfatase n=1 Tax=Muiribacterium halophilum TaxID=2053465 RepID=A0A2N5ZIT0_MUIH1|nr:MAG: sulfatase [Candidatus Muirbacterium halophilum]
MRFLTNTRYRMFLFFFLTFIIFSLLTRITFFVYSFNNVSKSITDILTIFLTGSLYDILTSIYYLAPFMLLLLIVPEWLYKKKFSGIIFTIIYLGYTFSLIFNMIAEYLFWQEFQVRYNFIAVDYLVYTQEVIGNIKESYNMPLIYTGMFIAALSITAFVGRFIYRSHSLSTTLRQRGTFSAVYILIIILGILFIDSTDIRTSNNEYNNELAENGIYQLFHSFRINMLDFNKYYVTEENALNKAKEYLSSDTAGFISTDDKTDFTRYFKTENRKRRLNVILITIESFSGDFIKRFGNDKDLTPNYDSLISKGVFFDRFFATGTRTVRGMEAITLSIPPTPGRSIVKRPENEDLESIGFILKENGYKNKFLYAGHGYFDNMNYFYAHNGFDIFDRMDMEDKDVTFSNILGVCDEDLYNQVLNQADLSYRSGSPFYFHVMTTSNHRPYTYPEGKVDIPSGTGRDGAVKYTDYAIGQLIKKASEKDWMKDTVFIITADHCASSAGKTRLNTEKYHIPLLFYSPGNLNPAIIDKVCSQVDLAPTILDLLGIEYKAKFYGQSIFSKDFPERAFIGNYQNLGLLDKSGILSIISPVKKKEMFYVNLNTWKTEATDTRKKLLEENISIYQSADYLFKHGLYKKTYRNKGKDINEKTAQI